MQETIKTAAIVLISLSTAWAAVPFGINQARMVDFAYQMEQIFKPAR